MTFAAALTVFAAACGQSAPTNGGGLFLTDATGNNVAIQPVVAPQLPTELYFAGERVPLENFDTRESLMRELLITTYMHSRTMLALLNSKRYFAQIEPVLARNGIPSDFKYLCVAESSLDPNAISSARAAGLWQIMPGTGTDYGLHVGPEADDRYDIAKATEVACRHLQKSKDRFGTWTMAAAAYNLGDAGVARRVDLQTGIDNYYDIWLPDETRRYLFRVLAFKLIFENPEAYGFFVDESQYYPLLTDYHMVTISERGIKWPEFAAHHGTTYKMLRELNHWIRDYAYANPRGRTLEVKIPNSGFRTGR